MPRKDEKERRGTYLDEDGYKVCSSCQERKTGDEFSNVKSIKDGKDFHCKKCKKEQREERSRRDPEYYRRAYMKSKARALEAGEMTYYQKNREKLLRKAAERSEETNVKARLKRRSTVVAAKRKSYDRARELSKSKRTPSWLTPQQKFEMNEVFRESLMKSKISGIKHHVDHIAPLNGANVCGLHVPWNLQVITAEENLSKGIIYYGPDAWPVEVQMMMRAKRIAEFGPDTED